MIRGFIAGGFWGAILGVIALALTSQLADWRDLTPAVAEVDFSDEQVPAVPPDPSDGAQDAPIVTAGTGAQQPRTPTKPLSATETAPEIAAPALETVTAKAPSLLTLPDAAPIPAAPETAVGSVEVAAIATAPGLSGTGGKVGAAPGVDPAPQSTDTRTALVPARLSPEAQTGIATQPAPAAIPDVQAIRVTAARVAPSSLVSSAPPAPLAPGAAPAPPSASPVEPSAILATGDAELGTARGDEAPVLAAASDPTLSDKTAPVLGAVDTETSADLPATETASVAGLPEPPQVGTARQEPVAQEDTVDLAALQQDAVPSLPAAPEAPVVVTVDQAQGAVPNAPEAPDAPAIAAPVAPDEPVAALDRADLPQEPAEPEPALRDPAPVQVAQADLETAPDTSGAAPERATPRVTRIGTETSSENSLPGVRIRRLPSIGDDAEAATPPTVAEAEGDAEADPALDPDAPALIRNAIDFEAAEDAALLSIVLVHVSGTAIETLPVPMTFAVPAGAPDAADVARAYRDAGHEVALIPDLPAGARAQDVEVALQVNLADIPDAVALIDTSGNGFQSNQAAVAQIVAAAAGTGHAVITRAQGLDSAGRLAARDGVVAARISSLLDPARGDRAAVGRALDRAAFRARSDGKLILAAPAEPDLVAGVLAWALENRDGDVALAPLSGVLQPGAEDAE